MMNGAQGGGWRVGWSSIDSIARRGARLSWAVLAACVLCLPLEGGPFEGGPFEGGPFEGGPFAARDGQQSLPSGQDASIANPGSAASLAVGPAHRNLTKDETEPGGPVFSFVDISATGTQLTFFDADNLSVPNADDGVATNVPLGFAFFFAGRTFTTVNMSTNGFLHFELNGESDSSANRCPIPDAVGRFVPKNFIAVLWDNLILSNPGSPGRGGYTQQFASCPNASGGTGPCTVFMWDNADHAGGAVDSFDVEAILYANGNILMQYGPGNPEAGAGSTTAVAAVSTDMEAAEVYACDMYGSIAADRAVLFARNISVGTVRISEFRLRGPTAPPTSSWRSTARRASP